MLISLFSLYLMVFVMMMAVPLVHSNQQHPHHRHHHQPNPHKGEKQWVYMPAQGWDQQYNKGVWNFLDVIPLERIRIAAIGSVLTRSYGPPNATILDVGCGEGILSEYLTPDQRQHYIGVDISNAAISRAIKNRGPPMQWVVAASHHYTPPYFMDFIIFSEVLYYVEFEKVLKQYEQYLTPNGKIIISLFHPEGKKETYQDIINFSENHFKQIDRFEMSGYSGKNWVTIRLMVYEKKPVAAAARR